MVAGNQRGVSLSSFFAVLVLALLLVAGLVVDGGAQALAARRAELLASAAARAGADATATSRLAGQSPDVAAAVAAAQRVLAADSEVSGEVTVVAGRIRVTTTGAARTVFLSLIGIPRLEVRGSAEAELVPNR